MDTEHRVTSAEVISHFAEHSAETLEVRAESVGLPGEAAFDWLAPSRDSRKPYGDFRIDVFPSPRDAARVNWPGESEPDGSGMRWTTLAPEHVGDGWAWLASKVYGNLLLSWWNDHEHSDSRLEALDTLLSELVESRE